MKTTRLHTVLFALCLLPACDFNVGDLNHPALDQLLTNPTPSAVEAVATGLVIGARDGIAAPNGYVSLLGVLGRESYNLDTGDPRFVKELLEGPSLVLDPGTPAIGGNFWIKPYANIRNANLLLNALPIVAGLADADKKAISGFAKTIQAIDFLQVFNTRDTAGAPIDVNLFPIGTLGPIVTKDQVLARIAQLLDGGQTDLQAAGAQFPFPLGKGFSGLDTPANFLKVNRALRARVAVYQGDFPTALTALAASFLDRTASLKLGAYHAYGTGPGDQQNGLISPNIYVHPKVKADADLGDLRVTGAAPKIVQLLNTDGTPATKTLLCASSSLAFTLYKTADASVPIIRNEELILLRAEANIGQGNFAAATDDINFIRASAGLSAVPVPTSTASALDELLKQKRYSLLFEGGHRWIDMRRYNRLSQLPIDVPIATSDCAVHVVKLRFPIPTPETDARQ